MNREIKFRMWSKEYKQMFSNEKLLESAKGMIKAANYAIEKLGYDTNRALPEGLYLPLSDEDAVFMQYTGLKDKNGVGIYEGDIIKAKLYTGLKNGQKTYDEEIFKIAVSCDNRPYSFKLIDMYNDEWSFDDTTEIEVTGNIYENPELLEVKE